MVFLTAKSSTINLQKEREKLNPRKPIAVGGKTLLLLVLSLVLFSSLVSAGGYFNITETFNGNSYGNTSTYDTYQRVYDVFDGDYSWEYDNQWFMFMSQGQNTLIYDIIGRDGLVFDSTAFGDNFGRWTALMNISRCAKDECYLSPKTRLEMYLEYEHDSLNPASLVPRLAFKKYYYGTTDNHLDFNSSSTTFDVLSGVGDGTYNDTSAISLTYRSNAGWEPFCNLTGFLNPTTNFLNVTLEDLPDDNPLCKVYYGDRIDGFFINIWNEDNNGIWVPEQNITDIKIFNLFNGTNKLPTLTVFPDKYYYCINDSRNYPIDVNLTFLVEDEEDDTIYYAYFIDHLADEVYKEYSSYTSFYGIWKRSVPDYSSLRDGVILGQNSTSIYCHFCQYQVCDFVFNNRLLPIEKIQGDFTRIEDGWIIYALELKNKCAGYDVYIIETDTGYKSFEYNTSLYGLNNGENYTISFLNQDLEEVSSIRVFADNGNISIWSSNGTAYVELVDFATDYNLTSLNIVYNDVSKYINVDGNTKSHYINHYYTNNIRDDFGLYDYINYVMINFSNNEDLLQSMYAYRGSVQELNWSSTPPESVPIYGDGYHTISSFVKDDLHDSYISYQFGIKVEQKKYCFESVEDYPVIDTVLGNPIRNLFDFFNLDEEFKYVIYLIFFILSGFFIFSNFKRTTTIDLPLGIFPASLICLGITIVLKYSAESIAFMVITAFTLVLIGVRK